MRMMDVTALSEIFQVREVINSSDFDFNKITTPGIYMCAWPQSNIPLNPPPRMGYGLLIVFNSYYIYQIFLPSNSTILKEVYTPCYRVFNIEEDKYHEWQTLPPLAFLNNTFITKEEIASLSVEEFTALKSAVAKLTASKDIELQNADIQQTEMGG